MEPQEEARTPGESLSRPPGASGSPTPDEEERPEGSDAQGAAPAGAEGDSAGADGLWGLPESKVLRTVPLLAACLPPDKCTVKVGRRFSEERDVELSTVCRNSGTLILYPGAEATNLEEFILDSPVYPSTIILIDGTWSQAKDIFYKNSLFRHPKQTLLRPLQALCSFQLQHGAQIRFSKEYLLKNGLYPKPMPKNKRKLRKMELLINSVKI
ncbi:Dtwd2 [Phodopus roborovskii]|uniref:tRNA-uridine aminocarboxypropyltransferase n=1 Tax=Phodopus roborovskii TaxID=109678 RepID=A0AAU9ZYF3_PHORO|nr:Dtwd2 [Phodopus roborovskii]